MQACVIAVVTALTLMLPDAAAGQVRAADLRLALDQLPGCGGYAATRGEVGRLVAAVDWLDRRSSATNPATVSEYLRSLQRAANLLHALPTSDVIEDVTGELEAKVEHCRKLGIGMGGLVSLSVNTRRGGKAVSNWHVSPAEVL